MSCLRNSYDESCVESFEAAQLMENKSSFQSNDEDDDVSSNACVLSNKSNDRVKFSRDESNLIEKNENNNQTSKRESDSSGSCSDASSIKKIIINKLI